MKEIIQNILAALGAVLLYFSLKGYIGTYADLHPSVVLVIGLGLLVGASKIASFISEKINVH